MHLWHRWETVEQWKGTATVSGFITLFRDSEVAAMIELQRCALCQKERGRVRTLTAEHVVDVDFIRVAIQQAEEAIL